MPALDHLMDHAHEALSMVPLLHVITPLEFIMLPRINPVPQCAPNVIFKEDTVPANEHSTPVAE